MLYINVSHHFFNLSRRKIVTSRKRKNYGVKSTELGIKLLSVRNVILNLPQESKRLNKLPISEMQRIMRENSPIIDAEFREEKDEKEVIGGRGEH